jgi:hypothetical protein
MHHTVQSFFNPRNFSSLYRRLHKPPYFFPKIRKHNAYSVYNGDIQNCSVQNVLCHCLPIHMMAFFWVYVTVAAEYSDVSEAPTASIFSVTEMVWLFAVMI